MIGSGKVTGSPPVCTVPTLPTVHPAGPARLARVSPVCSFVFRLGSAQVGVSALARLDSVISGLTRVFPPQLGSIRLSPACLVYFRPDSARFGWLRVTVIDR